MSADVKILGPDGQPMAAKPSPRAWVGGGYVGGSSTPYMAADTRGEHLAEWNPALTSPDAELNPYRDRIVARARDLARNDGWAAGAVTRLLDNAIGASFRPKSKPNHRALALHTGNTAFDAVWADEYGAALDARWNVWAGSGTGNYCDVERTKWMTLLFGVAFRHLLIDNDALAVLHWLPDRLGPGRAHYATAVQLIDPDRLSNPQLRFDTNTGRGGVVVDAFGAPVAYNIRRAHAGDWWSAVDSLHWDEIPRETAWGRPVTVHYFEPDRSGQHRGGAGIFTPVLNRMKMLLKYDGAELDGAIINAFFAAVAESPFDHELLGEALGEGNANPLLQYQAERAAFHNERRIQVGGANLLKLYPGEKFSAVKSERPNANFANFQAAFLRNMAQGVGAASTQISGNFAEMNYSSFRGELLEAWKTTMRRRANFGGGFASPIRAAWQEEAHDVDTLPLPAGAPDFLECRAAYGRCTWLGPGRGVVDSVAERKGSVLGMDAGLTTLEAEAAESSGEDYEDILDQRQVEIAAFQRRGLTPPTWSGMNPMGEPAQRTIADPEAA